MDNIFWLLTERYLFTTRTSIGRLFTIVPDLVTVNQYHKEEICYSLEDTARPGNIKVYGETCLPDGLECFVGLFENAHYGKVVKLYTEPDQRTIKFNNLTWTDVLCHNGTDFSHTDACVLAGKYLTDPVYKENRVVKEPSIYVGMKEVVRSIVEKKLKEGFVVKWRFRNLEYCR